MRQYAWRPAWDVRCKLFPISRTVLISLFRILFVLPVNTLLINLFLNLICVISINPNSIGIFARNHPKFSIIQHVVKKVPQLLDFNGIGTVANAKHPWLGYTQSWIQTKAARWSLMELVQVANAKHPWLGYTQSWNPHKKQPVEFDGFGTVANAKHPWLGYTQFWIQQKQPVEFDGFGTRGYMLYSLSYIVEYRIGQNQAKPGG